MWKGDRVSARMAARTRSAVPTGTVDLVTTTLHSFICWPMVCATDSTCCRSAEAVLAGRSAHRDEHDLAVLDRGADIGGEAQPPVLLIAAHHRGSRPGS